jgi:uncharacterized lipoprotein
VKIMLNFALDLVRAVLKAIKVILLLSIVIMLSACGKSSEEAKAEQIRKENAELAQQFLERAKNGTPKSSTWEPPKFDAQSQAAGEKK